MSAAQPPESEDKKPVTKDGKDSRSDVLAKILIQAVASGSIGAFVTALSTSEIPKLLLGGAISGTGVPLALAVAEPFTKRLKKGAGYVSEKAASGTEDAAQTWWTSLSGSERRYLEALHADCQKLEVEGFQATLPRIALSEVYIPLRLETERGNVYGQIGSDSTIWSFLPTKARKHGEESEHRFVIVADPGYGKTTLTRYLALSYSSSIHEEKGAAKLLPFLLRFREMHSSIQSETQPKLEDLLVNLVKGLPRCGELEITTAWIRQQLKAGLVMLDGLDEVPEDRRETVSLWAKRQMQEYDSVFILTSRPHGYDASLFQGAGLRKLEILDFTNPDKKDFLHKWYRITLWQDWQDLQRRNHSTPESEYVAVSEAQAKAQSEREAQQAADDLYRQIVGNVALNTQLAVNPLLLTIIAATHNPGDVLPERRVTLYKKMFELLLEVRPIRRRTPLQLKEACQNQNVLQALAFHLTKTENTQFSQKQGIKWIQDRLAEECLKSDYTCTPQKFLKDIEQLSGLLTGGDSDLYQFTHKTFQEYLTAIEIKEQNLESLLYKRLNSPDWQPVKDWREVFSFYAALNGADWLVKAVVELPENQKQQQLVHLLYEITKEEKSPVQQPGLRQRLEGLLATTELTGATSAKITLEQRFQQMIRLDDRTEVTSSPITWREYQQFLEAQNTGKFHSMAQPQTIEPQKLDLPVIGLSELDRHWFCTWLPTQATLQSEKKCFVYDLPITSTYQAAKLSNNGQFYILRQSIDLKYNRLLNYLASASWREADEETYRLMITTVGKEEGQWFDRADLEKFPCEDLRTIDRLWLQYSRTPEYPEGKWGFSVQKRIWQECGSPMGYNYNWEKFGDRVGWRKIRPNWLFYKPHLQKSPPGQLPWLMNCEPGNMERVLTDEDVIDWVGLWGRGWSVVIDSGVREGRVFDFMSMERVYVFMLFSRAKTCAI